MADDGFIKRRPHSVGGVMVEQTMLIPSAEMVAQAIRSVPAGQASSLAAVRQQLAAETGAEATCPITTQRHVRSLAEEAVAAFAAGYTDVVPFWRVLEPTKPNSARLPGGSAFQLARRRAEGIKD